MLELANISNIINQIKKKRKKKHLQNEWDGEDRKQTKTNNNGKLRKSINSEIAHRIVATAK